MPQRFEALCFSGHLLLPLQPGLVNEVVQTSTQLRAHCRSLRRLPVACRSQSVPHTVGTFCVHGLQVGSSCPSGLSFSLISYLRSRSMLGHFGAVGKFK